MKDDLCLECGHLISRESVCPFCGWTREDLQISRFFSVPKYKNENDKQAFIMETINEVDQFIDGTIQ